MTTILMKLSAIYFLKHMSAIYFLLTFVSIIECRLEQGIFESSLTFSQLQYVQFQRSAFTNSQVLAKATCLPLTAHDSSTTTPQIEVDVVLRSSPCGREFSKTLGLNYVPNNNETLINLKYYFDTKSGSQFLPTTNYPYKTFAYNRQNVRITCDGSVHQLFPEQPTTANANNTSIVPKNSYPLFVTEADEIYVLVFRLISGALQKFNVTVYAEFKFEGHYLSPIDRPLLPFFEFMCVAYILFAILWLIWCFWRWRDLLRIQYWIGAVIGIGLIEKMVFYVEYQKMNITGSEAEGAVEFAEILSCLKKTVSVILVIIVSVGYGVVKPRLGATLQKVIGLGFIYFLLCSIEAVVRVSKVQHESVKQSQMVVLPLLLLQLGMFYWVFTSLLNTTRALRLRRNEVKLSLYRHFTHMLIFCILSSVCYMLWTLITHQMNICLKDWKELWVDVAFWHLLFAVLLFVIMILWRPTINNQRYAFTPLLDNDDDDDEEDTVFSEAFTTSEAIKLRTGVNNLQSLKKDESRKLKERKEVNGFEEDLKWIEQNIPSTLADKALPAFADSDEEREQVKFEVSKMQ